MLYYVLHTTYYILHTTALYTIYLRLESMYDEYYAFHRVGPTGS